MLFDSLSFLIFFPIVVVAYYLVPRRFRWILLLVASCYFYMAFIPAYILVLAYLIVIDFISGIVIERSEGPRRKLFLIISIIANVGTLFFFKYFNFFSANVTTIAHLIHWNYSTPLLSILLPLGLSFHTFQSLAYVIEVYKKRYPAERHFGIYALYVMFFPQLVAGPIERPEHLLPQLHALPEFDEGNATQGLRTMVWGFFKKVVVADTTGAIVNNIYGNLHAVNGPVLAITVILFWIQLYADFSGYTDIARGAAKVCGVTLVKNFDLPFIATSIADYWRRWHISLSTWFRDYFYQPIAFALFFTFLVIGIWHGAGWTFVVFGIIWGVYSVFGVVTKKARVAAATAIGLHKVPWLYTSLQVLVTIFLAAAANIFFRATSVGDALYIIEHMWSGWWNFLYPSFWKAFGLSQLAYGLKRQQIIPLPLSYAIMFLGEYWDRDGRITQWLAAHSIWIRWSMYYGLIAWIIAFGYFQQVTFIYFQF